MAEEEQERDEEWFREVYGKEYTGPASRSRGQEVECPATKRALPDDDEEVKDPNAVPTDFTSREAKLWEAKAKAIERNWKRRKEEELHCKICGEAGHFAQGCPTTLGGSRKPGEVVERLPLKDRWLKPRLIGTGGSVIQGLEKDTGCRLKLEDSPAAGQGSFFVRISGPDRQRVSKAVDLVKQLVDQLQEEWSSSTRRPFEQQAHQNRLEQAADRVFQAETRRQWDPATKGAGRPAKPPREDCRHEQVIPDTLDELEQRFIQEALELNKEQSAEVEREKTRHRECMLEIQQQFHDKMMKLRMKQARRREEFLLARHQHHAYGAGTVQSAYALNQHASYEYASHYRKQVGDDRRSSPAFRRHF